MSLLSANNIETNKYELEVTASAEEFENAIQKAYMKARKNINVNGFRKGKAPRNMIEKLYGENVFFEDAVNMLVPDIADEAIKSSGYEIVTLPELTVDSVSKENGIVFKAVITVKPEVQISDYKGIEVTKTVNAVTEEDIQKHIDSIRERNGRIITVDNRAAALGDTVIIDFYGSRDGVPFDGGSEKNYELVLGSGTFIPGFEEQITGKNTGDEFTINITFPENYQMEELAGQPVEFEIVIHEIKTKELPELDDDFVKDASEFDTVDELKNDIRTKLEDQAASAAETEAENKLFELLAEKMQAEIPEVMFKNKVDELVYEFETRLSQQGLNLDMYLSFTGMTKDSFRESYVKRAETQVKVRLALEKIAELEGIGISDDETEEEIARIAEKYKLSVEKVKEIISIDAVKSDLKVAAASKIVKDNAKYTG